MIDLQGCYKGQSNCVTCRMQGPKDVFVILFLALISASEFGPFSRSKDACTTVVLSDGHGFPQQEARSEMDARIADRRLGEGP